MSKINGEKIPVTLLTGFLGSGKTTLLNYILQGNHGLRVAALVNDFGAINIDRQLVVGVEDLEGEGQLMELANGCICCTIRDDLLTCVRNVVERPQPPEYLLVEASGVSEPGAILRTFWHPDLRDKVAVDGVITVVDVDQVLEYDDRARMLILDQIGTADILILNKVDLVDEIRLQEVKEWTLSLVPGARILEAVEARVPLSLLLGAGDYRLEGRSSRNGPAHDHDRRHDHGLEFATWSYESERPFSRLAIQMALQQLPASVFRAKGILYLDDMPQHRAVFQLVGRRLRITRDRPWNGERPRSQIVAIGAPDNFDRAELTRRFEACLTDNLTWLDHCRLAVKSRVNEWIRAGH